MPRVYADGVAGRVLVTRPGYDVTAPSIPYIGIAIDSDWTAVGSVFASGTATAGARPTTLVSWSSLGYSPAGKSFKGSGSRLDAVCIEPVVYYPTGISLPGPALGGATVTYTVFTQRVF